MKKIITNNLMVDDKVYVVEGGSVEEVTLFELFLADDHDGTFWRPRRVYAVTDTSNCDGEWTDEVDHYLLFDKKEDAEARLAELRKDDEDGDYDDMCVAPSFIAEYQRKGRKGFEFIIMGCDESELSQFDYNALCELIIGEVGFDLHDDVIAFSNNEDAELYIKYQNEGRCDYEESDLYDKLDRIF